MLLLFTSGLLACLLPAASAQTDGASSYYPQSQQLPQQSGGFYPSPMRTAPYPAAAPGTAETYSAAPTAPTGPSGGGGYPGGLFPPTAGAVLPFLGIAPICTKAAIAITRLHTLVEPVKALVVGAFVFFAIKNYVIPYLVYYARAVDEEGEVDRSLGGRLDPVAVGVLRAVSRGVCLERIACHLGDKARHYPLTKEVVRAIDASDESEHLLTIFRAAATGEGSAACDVYRCDRRRGDKNKHKTNS